VQVLAAVRRGRDLGRAVMLSYAGREVACVPVEALSGKTAATDPNGGPAVGPHAAVDPCFDTFTGAVFAQRSRNDGSFTGPTLDAATLVVLDCGTGIAQSTAEAIRSAQPTVTGRPSC